MTRTVSGDTWQARQLSGWLNELHDEADGRGDIAIDPAALARQCMVRFVDPGEVGPPEERYGCEMYLRNCARRFCRGRVQADQHVVESQPDLFGGRLQRRYPCERAGEEVYVLTAHMSTDELLANEQRLRAEGIAKVKHADALRGERRRRSEAGA